MTSGFVVVVVVVAVRGGTMFGAGKFSIGRKVNVRIGLIVSSGFASGLRSTSPMDCTIPLVDIINNVGGVA